MTLFFPKMDGTGIIKVETKVVDLKKSPAEWLRQMMNQLSKAPNSEVAAVFSEKIELYSLFSEKDLLYLDFSSNIQKSFFPNIHLEQLAFEAFLASLKANFPFANQAKFLVEHEDAQQLWGHIYSQQPFTL